MSLKKSILKKIKGIATIPNSFKKYSDLTHSILVEIGALEIEIVKAINESDDINNLPFEDFFVPRSLQMEIQNVGERIYERGVLLHIFRTGETTIGLGVLTTDNHDATYYMVTCYELDTIEGTFKIVWNIPNYDKYAKADKSKSLADMLYILDTLRNYERVTKDVKLKHSILKLPKVERDTYVEYVVDLSKPYSGSGVTGGGSHATPREHVRRGHYRTRNGKRYFVRSTIVNEGSKGIVDKSYKA